MKILSIALFFITYLWVGLISAQNIELIGETLYRDEYFNCGPYLFGSYAYAASEQRLHILSIENPESPQFLKYYDIGIVDLDTMGNYAFAVTPDSGLQILDIIDPVNPIRSASFQTHINEIAISDDFAYTMIPDSGLQILSLANPLEPIVASFLAMPTGRLFVSGSYAYVAAFSVDELKIVDITDSYNPIVIGSFEVPQAKQITDVFVNGNIAYVTSYGYLGENADGYMQIVDITEPSNPNEIGIFNIHTILSRVFIHESCAYLSCHGFVEIVDVRDPENPLPIGQYLSWWAQFAFSGNLAYETTSMPSFRVLDVSYPSLPVDIGFYDSGDASAVYVEDDYAYVADGLYGGFKIVDISMPSNPVIVGDYIVLRQAIDLSIVDTIAYLAMRTTDESFIYGGLYTISISDPYNPYMLGHFFFEDHPYCIFVYGAYAYLGCFGLRIIDISDPYEPYLAAIYPTPNSGIVENMDVRDSLAYITNAGYGLRILDISDPHNPTLLGGIQTENIRDVFVHGNHAYVADFNSGILIIDIQDPSNPILAGTFSDAIRPLVLHGNGDYLYVGYQGGIMALDISNPLNPILAGRYSVGFWPTDLFARDEYIFDADGSLTIFRFTPDEIGENEVSLPKFSLLKNYPNPFNSSTLIRYNLSEACYVRLEIYDILGHIIRTLVNEQKSPGHYQVTWDASDSPSGLYFYKIIAGETSQTCKMLLLK